MNKFHTVSHHMGHAFQYQGTHITAGLDQNVNFTQSATTQDMHFSISTRMAGLDLNVNFTVGHHMGHAFQYQHTYIMARLDQNVKFTVGHHTGHAFWYQHTYIMACLDQSVNFTVGHHIGHAFQYQLTHIKAGLDQNVNFTVGHHMGDGTCISVSEHTYYGCLDKRVARKLVN